MALPTACVLPAPIDEESPDANRAPVIEPLIPNPDGEPVRLSCGDIEEHFLANISDDNLNDTLYYRFFIDYFRAREEDLLDTLISVEVPLRNRTRQAQADIRADNPILAERPDDIHIVELFVADREFDDSNVDDTNFIAKVPIEGGLTASYQWTVYPIECD